MLNVRYWKNATVIIAAHKVPTIAMTTVIARPKDVVG